MVEDIKRVKDFWQEYRAAVLRQGLPQARAEWFVRWAQRFARAVPGVPLRTRTEAHVRAFLSDLVQQAHVEPWQVEQALGALRVLYQEYLLLPWARLWPLQTHTPETARGLLQRESFRDGLSAGAVDAAHQAMLNRLRTELRARHSSLRTEQAYEHWMRRFVTFHKLKSPRELGPAAVKEYLEYLALKRKVSASTQNQALNALVFLYEQVIREPIGTLGDFTRAKRPKRLPVVLSRAEVNRLLDALTGTYRLMAGLLYGSGLRLMECMRLRVKDVDFAHNQIMVRDGKGRKDRVTILPQGFSQHCESIWHASKGNMKRTWRRASERSICGQPWRANTPAPYGNGSGSTCFRRDGCQWTLAVEKCVGIISTKMPSNGLLRMQL
jgi:Phage integrase, N-terminal SAM-like domain/Phage integrase family